jgi:hypothetical protein
MKIVRDFPPNYVAIALAFDLRGRKPVFAWWDVIFNPHGIEIGPELMAHEALHADRQKRWPGGAEAWWQQYIADPRFRLMEELLAHVAEYRAYLETNGDTRQVRRVVLARLATRIASPLYGNLISVRDAKIAIATPDKPFRTRLDNRLAASPQEPPESAGNHPPT